MVSADMEIFKQLSEKFSLIRLKGKRPIEDEWQRYCHHRREFDQIGFQHGDNAGIACGPASGVIVLDIDDLELYDKTAFKRGWSLPETRVHLTGSDNFHIFYRYPDDMALGNKSFKGLGFDIRGVGGQVVAPGSIHPDTGKPYTIEKDVPLADCPHWLIDLYSDQPVNGDGTHYGIDADSILKGIPKGGRDEGLFRYACKLRAERL